MRELASVVVLMCVLTLVPPVGAQQTPIPAPTPAPAPAPAAQPPAPSSEEPPATPTPAPPPIVEEVVVKGGKTITADTVEYYLGVAKGDPYDPAAIAKNFHRFWDSGLVADLKVEKEDIAPGKVRLIVTVDERPKVTEFEFKGNKKLSNSTLRDKLDTDGYSLRGNVPLKESEVQQVRQDLVDIYGKEGYASATVEPEIEKVGPNLRKVVFKIDEGAKVKIGSIRFEGNKVFSDRRLRHAMKKLKQKSLFHLFGKKIIWNKESWGEDSENIKKFYMNHGYKDIVVGEPKVKLVARRPGAATQAKKKFRMIVTIPIQEGRKFKLGSLKLEGATVFPDKELRKLYYVKLGKTYKYSTIENGNEAVRNLYQSRGYIYAYTNQVLKDEPDHPDTVDAIVQIYEGDRYRLGRLEFKGNTKTQDKVIRREFRLMEGSWMDMTTFRRSVFKVNQLGYFKLTDDPLDFKFDDKKKLVNVVVKGKEVGRTDVQFGAGYSESYGFFGQFAFNTRNFMGRGETLGVSGQFGNYATAYSLSFSEPYFLDRRMVIGGSIYKSTYDTSGLGYNDYKRDSKGVTAVYGFSVGDFGQISFTYAYEDVFAQYVSLRQGYAGEAPFLGHERPIPPPYPDMPIPAMFHATYEGATSSITPGFYYDSRDDPFDPSQGVSTYLRLRFAGGPLGGDFSYLRPEGDLNAYHPLGRRYILAANLAGGIILPFNNTEIPVYDRYRLGGEQSLRGLPYLDVLPRDKNGNYFVDQYGSRLGGDRYLQLNLEYQIRVGGPVKVILFSDIGNTWAKQQGWDLSLLRYTTGLEVRIFLPVFQAPLRFIYGINLKPFPDEKKSDFQFSIGTTF